MEAFNAEYNAGVPVLFPEPFVKEARNFLEAVKELEKFPQPVTAKMVKKMKTSFLFPC